MKGNLKVRFLEYIREREWVLQQELLFLNSKGGVGRRQQTSYKRLSATLEELEGEGLIVREDKPIGRSVLKIIRVSEKNDN